MQIQVNALIMPVMLGNHSQSPAELWCSLSPGEPNRDIE
jgi:hypothetical protein